jgi:hypothetical protein
MKAIKWIIILLALLAPLIALADEQELDDAQVLERVANITPTPASPVADKAQQQLLLRELEILESMPVDQISAHRTAAACFGEIPADAARVARTLRIDPSRTRWHSTGLYAAPGEMISVKIAPEIAAKGIFVRINGHTDNLARLPSWRRMPRVSRIFKITQQEQAVASHFGGLIYVDIGDRPPFSEPFEVEFANAVAAPFFVLGKTSDAEWIERVRNNPAPYAELVCERLCIALPSQHIRELENPTALMEFWDKTVAGHDRLGGHAHLRRFADRINIDVQISAGAAHSGYPTQGTSPWGVTDLEHLLREGSWGWFHELGHEAQTRPDKRWPHANYYTLSDSVECTVNLFSSHARDLHGIKSTSGWGWTSYPDKVMRRALSVVSDPQKSYGSVDVGHKLAMCLQIRDAFGWDTWAEVLGSYTRDFDEGRISGRWDDQRKLDELYRRLSKASGHDLLSFMRDYWRMPVGDAAAAEIAALDLPGWLPARGGLSGALAVAVDGQDFDLAGQALSFDGKTIIHVLQEPAKGSLTKNGDGLWRYVPQAGFEGEDSFVYGVESSSGHIVETKVRPQVGPDLAARD